MKCPICETENRPGVIVCENCHSDLYTVLLEQVSTKQLDKDRERSLQISKTMPSSNPIVIYVRNADEPIAISRKGQLTIGRMDVDDKTVVPDIDLETHDAHDLGVSRQHIELDAGTHPPTISDLGSYNGTFVNGQKLNPHETFMLTSGDEVRLGRLIIRLFYDA